jgi:glycosyltransferase involved in cell wall biosynthesis
MKKTNKKVDVIVKYFFPVTAGIETNVMETYTVLARNGWDVTIHTSNDVYMKKGVLSPREEIRGLHIKRYPFTKFGYFPDIDWNTTDAVCLHNFDIFPHIRIILYVLWLKMTRRKRFGFFLTPHGGFNPEWRVFSKIQAVIKSTYHFTIGTYLINRTLDGVRAVSNWEGEEMLKKGLKKSIVKVIPNGVEDEAYADLEKNASEEIKKKVKGLGKYIIQIGRIYPIKNYETDIRALPLIPADIKLLIVGPVADQKYADSLIELARSLGVENRVIFFGIIRGIDKYYLIKHAQMMVHMAIWESFCNVVHEGLSQGLVCLVANNTALPYLIKDGKNGFCIETTSHTELSKKINYVLKNIKSKRILEMKKENRRYGLEYSWQKVAYEMNDFYRGTIHTLYGR